MVLFVLRSTSSALRWKRKLMVKQEKSFLEAGVGRREIARAGAGLRRGRFSMRRARSSSFPAPERAARPGRGRDNSCHYVQLDDYHIISIVSTYCCINTMAFCAVIQELGAFDCVHRDRLIRKLRHYGGRGLSLELLESYLNGKVQNIDINGERFLNLHRGRRLSAPMEHCPPINLPGDSA
ncbi:hypothetical protein EVAR_36132_1 [Eumeta japonica]|uniref:Uncharacterized protein n=1 Tax=Eumeta variegata TaxID=151549 RepID=A0A4C1X2Y1_EUMVA|nr:hypothetical protein EVAR_36132_1 [Eumeta japonica]